MSALRRIIEDAPEGTLFSREGLLAKLDVLEPVGAPRRSDYVLAGRAGEIMRMEPRELRRAAARWERQQMKGERPEVRVSKKSRKSASEWLFLEEDCWSYARAHGVTLERVSDVPPDEDDEAVQIARRIFREQYG